MALTESKTIGIGTKAPDFELMDTVSNELKSLQNLKGKKGTAILFICNHCPFVVHINAELVRLANEYQAKEISFVAISSNDIDTYPQDGPEFMKKLALDLNYPFPYLFDENQDVALAYDAVCTPDIYLFDEELKLVYHGQLCDSRPGNDIPVTASNMRLALDTLLTNQSPLNSQKPSIGCGIKWKLDESNC